jgi:dTDP-3-amino-3,4,6-trideoxy-alpha-D-glucose transaminase
VSSVVRIRNRRAQVENGGRTAFVALDRQHAPLQQELTAAFTRVLQTSAFTLGAEVEQFEQEFGQYCSVEHCVGVASGTAALTLTLRAAGIGAGDEVIVPAHTYIASALAVALAGATPVLCDVDEGTGLIDPSAARAMVSPRTAGVVAVHLYGQVCDMAALADLAGPAGLLLLEDAAQAHGATYKGRRAGSLGSAGAFSFYPSKNLGALGDGGAVCTNDASLAERVRQLRNIGQRQKGEHVLLGDNLRLDGLQAALLRVKLPHLDGWNQARRDAAQRYLAAMPSKVRTLVESAASPCVFHLFPVRVKDRDALAAALGVRGIDTGIHYYPAVHSHAAWAGHDIRTGDIERAVAWAAEELSLPMHPDMSADEIDRVLAAVSMTVGEI